MRARRDGGFTVTELLVTVGIIGILSTVAIWEINRTLPDYRVGAAASRMLLDMRSTAALAARTNRPVIFRVEVDGAECGFRYFIEQDDTIYHDVCLSREYRRIERVDDMAEIRCDEEQALGLAPLPSCSLCGGGSMVFLPTGEVLSTAAVGDTIVFRTQDEDDGLVRAVGLRSGGIGRARIYQWSSAGPGWLCR